MRKVAVFVCLVVFISEFGPALSLRLHHAKQQNEMVSRNPEKRWVGAAKTLLHFGFKAVKVAGTYFSQVTGLLSLVSTVYTLIEDCKDTRYGPETKTLNDEIKTMMETINTGTPRLYDIQLDTKQLQILVENLNYHFNNTLEEMDKAGYLSERFLSIVNPEIESELGKTTVELEEMLNKAKSIGEKVDYAALTKSYYARMDKAVTLAVPILTSVIPAIPKMYKFAKTRTGNFKGWKLSNKFKNVKMPGANTKAFKGMKSWFSKSTDYIKTAKVGLRNVITKKYSKALNVVKKLKDAVGVLSSYVFGAFNIYNAVQNFGRKDCEKLLTKARETHAEVLKANQTYSEILANVTNAKEEMNRVKEDMLEQVTNEVFMEDIRTMKENMESIQGEGKGMQDMIDVSNDFLDTVPEQKDDITLVLDKMMELYQTAVGTLPHIYNCLNDRAALVSSVVSGCKEGRKELDDIIVSARTVNSYQPEDCLQKTGIRYFSEEELEQVVVNAAKEQKFNIDCNANNQDNIDLICDGKCTRKSVNAISRSVHVRNTTVVEVLKNCPLCEMTITSKKIICYYREKLGYSEEKLINEFKPFTPDQIKDVKCPVEETEE